MLFFAAKGIGLRIRESRKRILACLDELDEADLWKRPNASSNSVGNLLLHLKGNLAQWVLSGLDGAPDGRVRDAEFAAREGAAKSVLGEALIGAIDAVIEAPPASSGPRADPDSALAASRAIRR